MTNVLDDVSQVGIALLGVSSIFLVAKKNKWGFVLGLLSEPFWFVTTIINKQWGIVFLNFIYAGTWILGIYEWFYKKDPKVEKTTK
jgi:nicotinamide riboside transporter PnuC